MTDQFTKLTKILARSFFVASTLCVALAWLIGLYLNTSDLVSMGVYLAFSGTVFSFVAYMLYEAPGPKLYFNSQAMWRDPNDLRNESVEMNRKISDHWQKYAAKYKSNPTNPTKDKEDEKQNL